MFEKIKSKLTRADGDKAAVLGRNEPCHCGSGKKYKKCHLAQDEEAERKRLEKTESAPPLKEKEEEKDKSPHQTHEKTAHGPKAGGGFMRSLFNRKSGGG